MAIRATKSAKSATKAGLSVSTTLSNQPPVSWTDDHIKLVVNAGFADKSSADNLNSSAVQRVGVGIMAEFLNWRNSGHPENETVPDLAAIILTTDVGKIAKRDLTALMRIALIGDRPDVQNIANDKRAEIELAHSNKTALLTRAMRVACIVYRAGLRLDAFNEKLGVFMVAPSMLYEKSIQPVGRGAMEDQPVALNNMGLAGLDRNNDDAYKRVKCSVDQLERAYRSKNDMRAPRGGRDASTVNLSEVKPAVLASKVATDVLVTAVYQILCKDADPKAGPVLPDAFPDNVWNMLNDIAIQVEAWQNSEAFKAARKHGISSKTAIGKAA